MMARLRPTSEMRTMEVLYEKAEDHHNALIATRMG